MRSWMCPPGGKLFDKLAVLYPAGLTQRYKLEDQGKTERFFGKAGRKQGYLISGGRSIVPHRKYRSR